MKNIKQKLKTGVLGAIGLMAGMISPVYAVKLAQTTGGSDPTFGTIKAPKGVAQYDAKAAESGASIGLILFISNLIKIATVIAGVWVMFNFILAGWSYIIGAGDPKSHKDASGKMTNSIIGLVIIVSAYTIAALIGIVVFGDAGYIINPKIQGI